MLVAERPGRTEVEELRPLVGPSGIELFGGWYEERKGGRRLAHVGLWDRMVGVPRSEVYVTNLVKTFRDGENPEPWEIEEWEGHLVAEILKVKPQVIVAVGAHSARWFLPDFNSDLHHGLPFRWNVKACAPGEGDSSLTVVPILHPAFALRQPEMQSAFAWDLRQVKAVLDWNEVTPEYLVRPLVVPLARLQALVGSRYVVSLDTEGTAKVPECVTVSVGNVASVIYADDRPGLQKLQVFLDGATTITLHAALHDLHVTGAMGLALHTFDDTMLMARLAQEFEGEQGLKALAWRYLRVRMTEYLSLVRPLDNRLVLTELQAVRARALKASTETKNKEIAKGLKKIVTSATKILDHQTKDTPRKRWTSSKVLKPIGIPPEATWLAVEKEARESYACADPWATGLLASTLRPILKAKSMDRVYRINRGILPMLHRMEVSGVRVDVQQLDEAAGKFAWAYHQECQAIHQLVGRPVNPNAPEDVSSLLFDELGVTESKRTKGGKHFSTEDKYLEARKHEHPVIPLIIKARETKKHEGYCDGGIERAVQEGDIHVIHPDFRYTRVVSGRLAEWLLTLPKHSQAGKLIRSAFLARTGRRLVSMDMSQIELRAAAHLSQDPTMCRIYQEGTVDIHTNTAHSVLGAPRRKQDQDESLHRLPAKTTNFSILMGTTEYGLAESITEALASAFFIKHGRVGVPGTDFKAWTPDDCRLLIDGWYRTYPGVAAYNESQLRHARKHGFVADAWGRRRYVAGVYSHNKWIREAAEREAQSFAYQASAQGLMHLWMGKVWDQYLWNRLADVNPWLQVHDDLILEAREAHVLQTIDYCISILPQPWRIPIKSDAKVGEDWAHLTDAPKEATV